MYRYRSVCHRFLASLNVIVGPMLWVCDRCVWYLWCVGRKYFKSVVIPGVGGAGPGCVAIMVSAWGASLLSSLHSLSLSTLWLPLESWSQLRLAHCAWYVNSPGQSGEFFSPCFKEIPLLYTLRNHLHLIVYENCEIAIAISYCRADFVFVPGVAFNVPVLWLAGGFEIGLNQGLCTGC